MVMSLPDTDWHTQMVEVWLVHQFMILLMMPLMIPFSPEK